MNQILDLIGNTPMVAVRRLDTGRCRLFLKLENQNPAGSIKDLVTLAKTTKMTYSSAGHGTVGNILAEMLKLAVGAPGTETIQGLAGAVVQMPAVAVLAGLAVAGFGLLPNLAAGASWGALSLFVFLAFFGPVLQLEEWVLNVSPFAHIHAIPGDELVVLPLTQSFAARPDPTLPSRLVGERSAIRLWALNGLRSLWRAVRKEESPFPMTEGARELLQDIETAMSPMKAFLRECCVVRPGESVLADALYEAHREWCAREGHREMARSTFGRQLRAAVASIERVYEAVDGQRRYVYTGIRTLGRGESPENPGERRQQMAELPSGRVVLADGTVGEPVW